MVLACSPVSPCRPVDTALKPVLRPGPPPLWIADQVRNDMVVLPIVPALWFTVYAGMTVRDTGNDGRFCKGPRRFGTHNRDLEATGGIEPPNKGFANPRLNHLATSPASFEYIPLKPLHKHKPQHLTRRTQTLSGQLVPGVGLEPTRPFEHCALNAACLPFQHPGIMSSLYKNLLIINPNNHSHTLRLQRKLLKHIWQERQDSNPRPLVLETNALAN